jgi:hypothetical protein
MKRLHEESPTLTFCQKTPKIKIIASTISHSQKTNFSRRENLDTIKKKADKKQHKADNSKHKTDNTHQHTNSHNHYTDTYQSSKTYIDSGKSRKLST